MKETEGQEGLTASIDGKARLDFGNSSERGMIDLADREVPLEEQEHECPWSAAKMTGRVLRECAVG